MNENIFNFAVKLYQAVSGELALEKNMFISPYSISSALSMLLLGAKENTALELQSVLGFSDHALDIHNQHKKFINQLSKINENVSLLSANKLFIEKSYVLLEKFLNECKNFYCTNAESLKFADDPDNSRISINNWVEQQTNNRIKDLISSGGINAITRLVIVNALYFKGDWESKFDSQKTKMVDFYVSKSKVQKVQMMTQKSKFLTGHDKDLDVQIVKVPYKNNSVSMIIYLPNDRFGLSLLEKQMSPDKLYQLEERCFKTDVILSMPKFKIEDNLKLKPVLKSLGISDAFDSNQANFSGITKSPELFVSNVFHKTFIEVNEKGTEAAAATAVVMMLRSLPLQPVTFTCDHPFLFIIRDNLTKAVLFIGRVVKP